MVSGRIPRYVKEYCEKNKITISQIMMAGFDYFRSLDREHALTRLDYHQKRVLHWSGIVLQNDTECNTKHQLCNAVKKEFLSQGRGSPETKTLDMNWLETKANTMVNDGILVSKEELYKLCLNNEKGGKK